MNAWLRWWASVGLGIFIGYESHHLENNAHSRRVADGIAAEASHDVLIDHIEPIFPAISPPEPPVKQNWRHHDGALARGAADRRARSHAVNADHFQIMAASRGVVLRSG